jgi:hypothetical protein
MLRCVEAADATLRVKNRIPEDPRGSAADRLLSIVPLLMHLEDEGKRGAVLEDVVCPRAQDTFPPPLRGARRGGVSVRAAGTRTRQRRGVTPIDERYEKAIGLLKD